MQKFTRPITREIELGGERLAVTFTEQGIAVRPVGSRKPPREATWAAVLTHLAGAGAAPSPTPEQLGAALEQLRGPGAKPAPKEDITPAVESPPPMAPSVPPSAPPP